MHRLIIKIHGYYKLAICLLLMAIATGLATSFFLQTLQIVTNVFHQYKWLLAFMPLAGVVIYFIYKIYPKSHNGTNDILDVANGNPTKEISKQMWWQVLLSTLLTHIVGGSAGREGTAVQMGGSIAAVCSKWLHVPKQQQSIFAYASIAAGFAAVFGTPIAAAFFAIEVVAIGKKKFTFLPICLVTAYIAHLVCMATNATHTVYSIAYTTAVSWQLLGGLLLLAICCGFTAHGFIVVSSACKKINNGLPHFWVGIGIATLSSCLVLLLFKTYGYFGLGVQNFMQGISIEESIQKPMPIYAFAVKLLLTAIVLNFGFKGGEVTPLFFIGALLGNAVATSVGMPIHIFAAVGFVTVFAVASNTIIASIIMGAELFGLSIFPYAIVVIPLAYFFSSCKSIYASQLYVDKKICLGKFLQKQG